MTVFVMRDDSERRREEERLEKDQRSFGVTASIGLTALCSNDAGLRDLLSRADEGTYAAKAGGRNQVVTMPLPPER